PDHRLVLFGQVDALGIATAFDVEHHAFAPAVLVVADQVATRVGGQGGLAGAGQAEEQGDVTVFTDVGGAVHRQHVLLRQQEVLHREHGLLHLAGVAHAGDQHLLLGEVDDHATVGVGAVTLGHALEVGHVEHLPLVLAGRIVGVRIDEQLTTELVLPGGLGGHLHRQVVLAGGPHMHVGDDMILGIVEGHHAVPERIGLVGRERTVDGTPGDLGAGARFVDDETVGRRTSGAMTGANHQRAIRSQFTLAAAQRFLDQLGSADIGVNSRVTLRHVRPRRQLPSPLLLVVHPEGQYRKKSAGDYASNAALEGALAIKPDYRPDSPRQ